VSSVFRAGILSRLAALPETNWVARAWRARALAGSLSWMAEVSAFTALSRAFADAPLRPFAQDLASAGLTLGAFKLSGFLGNQVFLKSQSVAELAFPKILSPSQTVQKLFYSQSAMLMGLLASKGLEAKLGWAKATKSENLLLDTVGSLLSLNLSSSLAHQALGPKFSSLERELGMRADIFTQFGALQPKANRKPSFALMHPVFSPMWMAMGMGGIGGGEGAGGGGQGFDHDTIPAFGPPEEFISPGSGGSTLGTLDALKRAMVRAETQPARLLHVISGLMHLAFSEHTPVEVRRESGRTLFKEGYFRRWQELLKEEGRPELQRLAALSEPQLKDLAGKFLVALEEIVRQGEDLKATRLIGPVVYAAYRSRDRKMQTAVESFLIRNPNPAFRLAALVNNYPDLHESDLQMLFWKNYERILAFDDLFSTNPNRRSFGRAVVRQIHKAEQGGRSRFRVMQEIVDALDKPEKLSEKRKLVAPEREGTLAGAKAQIMYFLSKPLEDLPPALREKVTRELSEELFAESQAMGFEALRFHFIEEGPPILPGSSPMKLMPGLMTRKIRSLVQTKKINRDMGEYMVAVYKKLFKVLDVQMQSWNHTSEGYLTFIDPFAN